MRRVILFIALALLAACSPRPTPTPTPEPDIEVRGIGVLPRLSVTSTGDKGKANDSLTFTARLTTSAGAAIPDAKLILSLNHEGNRELVSFTNATGQATFSLPLVDNLYSSCCVDASDDPNNPTLYTIRVRFDGDSTYKPIWVDLIQGYRAAPANTQVSIAFREGAAAVASGSSVPSSVQVRVNGTPTNGIRVHFGSHDLGQYSDSYCTTATSGGQNGICAFTWTTDYRNTGSYGISAVVKSNTYLPASAHNVIHITSGGPAAKSQPQQFGFGWWADNAASPTWSSAARLGVYRGHSFTDIDGYSGAGTGYNTGADYPTLNTTGLDSVVSTAYGRTYTRLDGTTGRQAVVVNISLKMEELTIQAATHAFLDTSAPVTLNSDGCAILKTWPIHDTEWARRYSRLADAFYAWYNSTTNGVTAAQKQAVVIGFTHGAGFAGEWSEPFTNNQCKTSYQASAGIASFDNAWATFERTVASRWGVVWANTPAVVISSSGDASGTRGSQYNMGSSIKVTGEPAHGNGYKTNSYNRSWISFGRRKGVPMSCEDPNGARYMGAYADASHSSTGSVGWHMMAYAAHLRCWELHADEEERSASATSYYWQFFGVFEYPEGTVQDFLADSTYPDDFGREIINATPIEDRRILAWWAHEAGYSNALTGGGCPTGTVVVGYRKGERQIRSCSTGYNSDIYGDLEAGIVRRELSAFPTTPILRKDLPTAAKTAWQINPFPMPGKYAWSAGNSGTPSDDGAMYSARSGSLQAFDIHDGWIANHSGTITLEVHFLNNNAGNVTVSWVDTNGTIQSTTFSRSTSGTVDATTINLTNIGLSPTGDPFGTGKGADLQLSGTNLALVFMKVSASAATPSTPVPTSTTAPSATSTTIPSPTVTQTPTNTPDPSHSATPLPSATATATVGPTLTPSGRYVSAPVATRLAQQGDSAVGPERWVQPGYYETMGTKGIYYRFPNGTRAEFVPFAPTPTP